MAEQENKLQEAKENVQNVKEDIQDAKDVAKIAAKAAAGDSVGAAKDAVKKVVTDPKFVKKTIKRYVISTIIPIVALVLVGVFFFAAIFEAAQIIRETLENIGETVTGWIDGWISGDGINVDDDDVDAFIEQLERQGVYLADMGFGADEEDMQDDPEYENLSNTDKQKKKARKYIKKFMEASLVTQNFNTHKNGLTGIPGGIELERCDAETGSRYSLVYTDSLDASDYSHFTLNSEGNAVFNSKGSGQRVIDISAYEQYSLPVMYFVDLCLTTQNPKYVEALADKIINSAKGQSYSYGTGETITETGDFDVDGYTQRIVFNGVEYKEYKQNSARWSNYPYWDGSYPTIGHQGCGPTSVAVVLSGFSQTQNITPVNVADFMTNQGTSANSMSSALSNYGVSNTICWSNFEGNLRDSLNNNKPVICSFNNTVLSDGTRFTSGGHISVALAINGDMVYISNVYNSTGMRTGWVPISDVVRALSYMIKIDSNPDNFVNGSNANSGNSSGTNSNQVTSLDGFLFIGDSRVEGIESRLEGLGNNITAYGVSGSTAGQWISVTADGSGYVPYGSLSNGSKYVSLPESVNGVSIMLGTNMLEADKMKTVLNNLHTRYPNVTIYVDSIYHVGSNHWAGTPVQFNAQIDNFNSKMQEFCSQNSWAVYVDITAGLHDSSGLLKSEFQDSEGLHMNSEGNAILVRNMADGILGPNVGVTNTIVATGEAWMKISILDSCTVTTRSSEYTYSYEDPTTGEIETATGTTGPYETRDYTTSYYVTEVNHLLFKLSQTYSSTYNESTSTTSFHTGNSYRNNNNKNPSIWIFNSNRTGPSDFV